MPAVKAPSRSFTPSTVVSEIAKGPTDTLTSRAESRCECQVRGAVDAAGSTGSPEAITVSLPGATTVITINDRARRKRTFAARSDTGDIGYSALCWGRKQ